VDYLEHGRTFPNQRANAGPDQTSLGFRSSSGRCVPSRHPAKDHPQVLIIALTLLRPRDPRQIRTLPCYSSGLVSERAW